MRREAMNKANKKVSLILTTYNCKHNLVKTLESIEKQDYPEIEVIIKDGGSTDGTLDVISKYQENSHNQVKWETKPDKGIYDAMNKGISMATGDIVGIINSDDFYHRTDILQIVADTFKDKSVQALYGDVRFVNDFDLDKTVRYYSSKNFSSKRFRFGFMPAHPTFFTYKKYYDDFGYYKLGYKIAADFELLIRFLYVNKLKYKYLSIDFMKMRTGGTSTASIKSNWILNKEIVWACKENGIWTCMPLLFLKYFVKVFELIFTRN